MRIVGIELVDSLKVEVVVGRNILGLLGKFLANRGYGKAFLVYDRRLPREFIEEVVGGLKKAKLELCTVAVEGGEHLKTVDTVVTLWKKMFDFRLSRGDMVIGFGGGTLTDTVGFAAATYMRGIDWTVIPTTLLAMADAAIGGKTSVNFGAKNLVGAYHHPKLVVEDVKLVKTLSWEDYVSGLAEVVKHALLSSREFYQWLAENIEALRKKDLDAVEEAITKSVEYKLSIVSRDYRETKGLRMLLNLGHTIGHAIERALDYQIRHGHAISIGLIAELWASHKLLGLPVEKIGEVATLLQSLGLPTTPPREASLDRVLDFIRLDKKRRGDKLVLPLLEDIGKPKLVTLDLDEALQLLGWAYKRSLSGAKP